MDNISKTIRSDFFDSNEQGTSQKLPEHAEDVGEASIVVPPDGGWGWVVVAAAFFSFFIADGLVYSFGIFLEDMSKSFKCSKSQVSLIGTVMNGFYCITGPFVAALVNRYGFRLVGIIGCILSCISFALASISPSISLMFVTHGVLTGFGFCMIYIPAVIIVGFYFERWRALATGIAVCGAGMGSITLPPLLTFFLKLVGWRNTFRILSLTLFGCIFFVILFRPLKPIQVKVRDTASNQTESVAEAENKLSFFGAYHNSLFPRMIDVNTKSTITLFQPLIILQTASSELITASSSVKTDMSYFSNSTKNADSKLSTVYEETKQSLCTKCCCKLFFCCNNKASSFQSKHTAIEKKGFQKNSEEFPMRPLYRDDIFYSGSLIYLPQYKKSLPISQQKLSSSLFSKHSRATVDYHLSVSRVVTQKDIEEQRACILCPDAIKRTLATMLDINLLKSPSFLLLAFNAGLSAMGYYTPYMFLKDRAIQEGMGEKLAVWLLSTIGALNTFGRVLCGIVTTNPAVKTEIISSISLLIAGIATVLSNFTQDTQMQFIYAGVFGLSVACMSTLRTILIVEVLGLDKLTNAIGIILLFQGVFSMIGTALSGLLRDLTGDYKCSFYFAGVIMVVAAFILTPIKSVAKWENKKKEHDSVIFENKKT